MQKMVYFLHMVRRVFEDSGNAFRIVSLVKQPSWFFKDRVFIFWKVRRLALWLQCVGNTWELQTRAKSVNVEHCSALASLQLHWRNLTAKQPSLWAHWTVYRKSFSWAHFMHQAPSDRSWTITSANRLSERKESYCLSLLTKVEMFTLMAGNKTSPHVQIFMKLVLNLPLSKTVQSCATIDRGQKHVDILKPNASHSDERVAHHHRAFHC